MDKKKFFLIGLAIISFFWFQSLAFGQESQGLSDLQQALKLRGARWEAGENSMTRLSPEERQKQLGLVRPVHTGKEPMLPLETQAPVVELPASLDWRNHTISFDFDIRRLIPTIRQKKLYEDPTGSTSTNKKSRLNRLQE